MNTMVGPLFPKLLRNQQKGSKPRCHLLTSGTTFEVAARLTKLIAPWGEVRSDDRWMPSGFEQCGEAQLHSADELIPDPEIRDALLNWWLACPRHLAHARKSRFLK